MDYVKKICSIVGQLFFLLGAFRKLQNATISLVMAFRLSGRLSAWNNSAPTGRIFVKFDICGFFENMSRKFKFH